MIARGPSKRMRTASVMVGAALLTWSTQSAGRAAGPVTVAKMASPEKALRFEVIVLGSLDQVWAAFTTSDGLATWLWSEVRVDARPGGDWLAIFPGSTGGSTLRSMAAKAEPGGAACGRGA